MENSTVGGPWNAGSKLFIFFHFLFIFVTLLVWKHLPAGFCCIIFYAWASGKRNELHCHHLHHMHAWWWTWNTDACIHVHALASNKDYRPLLGFLISVYANLTSIKGENGDMDESKACLYTLIHDTCMHAWCTNKTFRSFYLFSKPNNPIPACCSVSWSVYLQIQHQM